MDVAHRLFIWRETSRPMRQLARQPLPRLKVVHLGPLQLTNTAVLLSFTLLSALVFLPVPLKQYPASLKLDARVFWPRDPDILRQS